MGLRALMAPLAGSTRMPFARFLLFDTLGALVWSGLFIGAGYALGSQAALLGRWFRGASLMLGLALLIAFGAYLVFAQKRRSTLAER